MKEQKSDNYENQFSEWLKRHPLAKKIIKWGSIATIIFSTTELSLQIANWPKEPYRVARIGEIGNKKIKTLDDIFKNIVYLDRKEIKDISNLSTQKEMLILGDLTIIDSHYYGFVYNTLQNTIKHRLKETFPKIKFSINTVGKCGFKSKDFLEFFEPIVSKYSPDILVFYLGSNEYIKSFSRDDLKFEYPFNTSPYKILQLIGYTSGNVFLQNFKKFLSETAEEIVLPPTYLTKEDDLSKMYLNFESNLRKMAEIAQENNIPAIFCTIPINRHINELSGLDVDNRINDIIRKIAEETDIYLIDVKNKFEDRIDKKDINRYFNYWYRLNIDGAKIIGEILGEEITKWLYSDPQYNKIK